jgi:signal peptidase
MTTTNHLTSTKPSSGKSRLDRVTTWVLTTMIVAVVLVGYGLTDNRWYRIVSVEGASMQPTIGQGDAIVLVRPPAVLEEGQIVTLQVNGLLVTHRVVAVDENGRFVTQGDANETVDDWEGTDLRVAGRVLFSVPGLGKLLDLFSGS